MLLRHVRAALSRVAGGTENGEHQALLACADVVLNELMLRSLVTEYLPFIRRGLALVEQGQGLLVSGSAMADLELPAPITEDSSPDGIFDALDRISMALAGLVASVEDVAGTEARTFCDLASDWEASLYARSLAEAGQSSPPEADPFTRARFEAYLRQRFPEWPNLAITQYTVLTGGFSKRTVLFDVEDDANGKRSLILRAEQAISLPRFSDIVQEFHLAQYVVDARLPTPAALWLETDLSHFGWAFAIMEKAEGLNFGWTMGRKAELTPALVDSVLDAISNMHSVAIRHDDPRIQASHLAQWSQCRTVSEATSRYVSTYMQGLIRQTGIDPSPELVRAMRWLQANVPDVSDPPVLVHHDFGLNNMLLDGERVSAILDWESAIVVDPAYDILVIQRELAEVLPMEEFLDRYHARTGRRITPYNMAYAKVAAFAIYMIVYLNGRQSLIRNEQTPIAMSLLSYRYIANTSAQLNALITEAESLR